MPVSFLSIVPLGKVIALLWALIGFGTLITVHEFGHFIFCKLFGVHTPIFSVGFGPSLFQRKIGDTEFRLSLLPLGGYCAIAGAGPTDLEDGHQDTEHLRKDQLFTTKPYWQKTLIILGGILFNILFAYGIFTFLNYGKVPKSDTVITLTSVEKESLADEAGMKPGDILVGYNNTLFSPDPYQAEGELQAFLSTLAHPNEKTISIMYKREDGSVTSKKIALVTEDTGRKRLGVGLMPVAKTRVGEFSYNSLTISAKKGIAHTHRLIKNTFLAIKQAITGLSIKGMGGPLRIMSQSFKMAEAGISELLSYLGMISVSLAVMNLLPLGILDGGQLIFVTLEALRGKPLSSTVQTHIMQFFIFLFLFLFIVLSYHDLRSLLPF